MLQPLCGMGAQPLAIGADVLQPHWLRTRHNKDRVEDLAFRKLSLRTELRIEGRIIGFDEYMNCVLEDADEIILKKN